MTYSMVSSPPTASEVPPDGSNPRVVEITTLYLRNLPLPNTNSLSELNLGEACLLTQFAQTIGTDFCEHTCFMIVDDFAIHRIFGDQVFITQCHLGHFPLNNLR